MRGAVIISKDGVKREISFPFEICLSREDARWFRDQLKQMDEEFSYGWIDIAAPIESQSRPDTKPLAWTDPRNTNPPSGNR